MLSLRCVLLIGGILGLLPAYGQNSLSPKRDSTTAQPLPDVPAGELDELGDEGAGGGEDAGARTGSGSGAGNGSGPCCQKKSFRLAPRHTWDVNIDGTFVLPRFVSFNHYGYGYYSYYNSWLYNPAGVQAGGSASLLVRRNLTTRRVGRGQGVRRGAWRYGLTLGFGIDQVDTDTLTTDRSNLLAYGVFTQNATSLVAGRFGYERQEVFGRFQLIYGYEADLSHSWRNQRLLTTFVQEQNRQVTTNFWYRGVGASAAALAGARFYLHPRFSVAIEARYEVTYIRWRQGGGAPTIYPSRIGDRNVRGWSLNYRLVPLSGLYMAFHFGKPVRVR